MNAYLVTDQVGDGDPDGIDRAGDVPLFSSSLQIFMQVRHVCAPRDTDAYLTPGVCSGRRLSTDQVMH